MQGPNIYYALLNFEDFSSSSLGIEPCMSTYHSRAFVSVTVRRF